MNGGACVNQAALGLIADGNGRLGVVRLFRPSSGWQGRRSAQRTLRLSVRGVVG